MYNKFFGFKEKPFKLVPNPEYLFLSKSHEEALAHLSYAIAQGDGFVEITGEVGTGKTTLCRVFLENLDKSVEAAYIFNPKLDALQLLKAINDEFGIDSTPDNTKDLIDKLNAFLIEKKAAGQKALVIIDEAQNLSLEVLEQLRLLSNLETTQEKLLQIILVGQPELGDMLSSHQLRQLGQRITINCQLSPLTYDETRDYIRHRIALASHRAGPPFDKASYRAIYDYSRGIPRLINIACDRALLNAFSRNTFKVTGAITKEAIGELTRNKRANHKQALLQGPVSPVVIAAVFVPLIILLLYLANGQSFHPDVTVKQSSPGSAVQEEVRTGTSSGEKKSAAAPVIEEEQDKGKTAVQESSPAPVQQEGQASTSESFSSPEHIDLATEREIAPVETGSVAETGPLAVIESPEADVEDIAVHSVHVGIYPSADQANRLVAELQELGYPSFMYSKMDTSGNADYIVVAGKYQSYDQAREASKALSKAGYSNFIAKAKDSLAAGPTAAAQQAPTSNDLQQPQPSGYADDFLNYLKGLNSRSSRNSAMEKILSLWVPTEEVTIKNIRIASDRFFFQEAAKNYGLKAEPVATVANLALVETLDLPAVFTFYLVGHSWPKYLAVAAIDADKIYFADGQQDQVVSVDRDVFLQYWSGEAYVFWKNFNGLNGMISSRSSAAEITALKNLLQQIGYSYVVMSGAYDKDTVQIIKDIQVKYGLRVDGVVGPFTQIVLYNESGEFVKPSLVKYKSATAEKGS